MFFINQKNEEKIVEVVDGANTRKMEEKVASLRAKYPSRRIVVFAEAPTWQGARAAFEAGANDYLPKTRMAESEREPEDKQPIPIW